MVGFTCAAATALADFYTLLSKYTRIVPRNVDGADSLTVLVNICAFVGPSVLVAGVCMLASVCFFVGDEGLFSRLFGAFVNIGAGTELRHDLSNNHLLHTAGLLLYVMAVVRITPLYGLLQEHVESKLMSAILYFSTAYFVFDTDLHIRAWKFVTVDPLFRVIPISTLGFWGWLAAIIGASVYLGLYAAFQIWYTDGKWWQQLRRPVR
jgi:hypothetical protein